MAISKLHSWTDRCAEPPRDGEFDLQAELTSEEHFSGHIERAAWKLAAGSVTLWDKVMRYPVLSACLAITLGVVITSLFMISPPA